MKIAVCDYCGAIAADLTEPSATVNGDGGVCLKSFRGIQGKAACGVCMNRFNQALIQGFQQAVSPWRVSPPEWVVTATLKGPPSEGKA